MDLLQIKGKYDIQIVKLRDIADKVTQKNSAYLVSETFTNSAEKGIISQEDYFERTITNNKNISGYYIVNPDDFVYNPRVSTLAPVGPINRNKLGRTGVISPLYLVFRVHNVEPGYLEWYFKSNAWHNFMLENGNTGARSDRFSISDTEFFSMPIPLPPMNVQKIIANTLDTLEIKINYAKVKAEKLRNFKSSMLTKIFPKEGKKVPEIRFDGFTDDWEQRKFSEIADKAVDNRGKTPTISEDGIHPLLEVASLGSGAPDYSKVTKYLSDDTFKTELRAYIKKDDILFSTVGSIGLVSLMDNNENAAIAQNIVAFRANEQYDSKFLYAMLSTEDNQYKAQRIVMGAVQPSIKVSQLVEVEYCVTKNIDEQRKLGEYFLNLDHLITLHQRKYEKLLDVKKAMLSKLIGGAN